MAIGEGPTKVESERKFEQNLTNHGYDDWEFEPGIEGRSRKPDYHVNWQGSTQLLEVKELHAKAPIPTGAYFINPYAGLRKEINEGRIKFKEFKDHTCSLVVYVIDDWEVRLDPESVFAAMLGDLGFTVGFDVNKGQLKSGTEQNSFLSGGKMVRPGSCEPQNTTISAIIVLEDYSIKSPALLREARFAVRTREKQLDRPLEIAEELELRANLYEKYPRHGQQVARVVVFENPFARRKLPASIFRGPYDERWLYDEPDVKRTFAGSRLLEVESLELE